MPIDTLMKKKIKLKKEEINASEMLRISCDLCISIVFCSRLKENLKKTIPNLRFEVCLLINIKNTF